jgi:hypothetical protein
VITRVIVPGGCQGTVPWALPEWHACSCAPSDSSMVSTHPTSSKCRFHFLKGRRPRPASRQRLGGTAEAPFPSYVTDFFATSDGLHDLQALPERPCQHLLHGLDAVDGLVRCEGRPLERLAVIEPHQGPARIRMGRIRPDQRQSRGIGTLFEAVARNPEQAVPLSGDLLG